MMYFSEVAALREREKKHGMSPPRPDRSLHDAGLLLSKSGAIQRLSSDQEAM
jgi:hypothetical protein